MSYGIVKKLSISLEINERYILNFYKVKVEVFKKTLLNSVNYHVNL